MRLNAIVIWKCYGFNGNWIVTNSFNWKSIGDYYYLLGGEVETLFSAHFAEYRSGLGLLQARQVEVCQPPEYKIPLLRGSSPETVWHIISHRD